VRPSTVTIVVRKDGGSGIGSGFIYSADGYICTNHHVIDGALSQQVVLSTGEAVDAVIVGSNADADIAVLKIEKEGLTPVTLGSSDNLLTGEAVMAVGTPASLEYAGTATFGRVSYPKRLLPLTDSNDIVYKKMTLIQTDTVVNHGNSGGPLADMYGRVVGIVVMKLGTLNGTAFDGIGFAIPIDGAKVIIDAIIKTGSFEGDNPIAEGRTVLGLSGRGLVAGMWYDDPAAENVQSSMVERPGYFYMPCDGVYVMNVTGADAMNKLKKGDIITKIDGLDMRTVYDVIDAVNRHYAGESVTLTVMRAEGEKYVEITVELILSLE
jgi:serine protease Do